MRIKAGEQEGDSENDAKNDKKPNPVTQGWASQSAHRKKKNH
jgi:hypothetical protein